MEQYSCSQPSSSFASPASSINYRDRRSGKFSIPKSCNCGGRKILETVQSDEGGRLFYKCENYFDGGLHLINSWEKAVIDKSHDLQVKNFEQEDRIAYHTRGPDGECVQPSMQWAELKFLGEQMKELQQLVRSRLYTERMEELVGNSSGAQSSPRLTNNIINVAIAFLLFVLLLTMVYSAFK